MQYFYQNNHSCDLIVFFSGWGCDYHQFANCAGELDALLNAYKKYKSYINPTFDKAIMAENDLIFNLQAQKGFYKERLSIIPNARHHIFFHFNRFEDIIYYF